jgi:hypothetical protein
MRFAHLRGRSRLRCTIVLVLALSAALIADARGLSPVSAQQHAPLTADVTLDKTRSTIGDPVVLTLDLRYDKGVQVLTDGITDQLAPFELLSADPLVDHRNGDGSGDLTLRFRIAAFRTGQTAFPPIAIPYASGGQTASVQTGAIPFTVDSVIPTGENATTIRPLKAQLDLPLPAPAALRGAVAAAIAVVVVAMAALLIWRTRRKDPIPVESDEPRQRSLELQAQAELDRIVEENYLARGDYRTHYARIAECIRRYITERYGFQASALTTSELSERMIECGVGRWRARLIADLLSECDDVYYAHYLPAPARADADLQMAYEIVDLALSQQTRPEEGLVESRR